MKRRLTFVRALLGDPELLILDDRAAHRVFREQLWVLRAHDIRVRFQSHAYHSHRRARGGAGELLWVFIRAGLMALGVTLVLLVPGLMSNPWALLISPLVAGFLAVPCAAIGLLAAA